MSQNWKQGLQNDKTSVYRDVEPQIKINPGECPNMKPQRKEENLIQSNFDGWNDFGKFVRDNGSKSN